MKVRLIESNLNLRKLFFPASLLTLLIIAISHSREFFLINMLLLGKHLPAANCGFDGTFRSIARERKKKANDVSIAFSTFPLSLSLNFN